MNDTTSNNPGTAKEQTDPVAVRAYRLGALNDARLAAAKLEGILVGLCHEGNGRMDALNTGTRAAFTIETAFVVLDEMLRETALNQDNG